MDLQIMPMRLFGAVKAIPSKSQAHRALICAALADAPTRVLCEGVSDDIAATADCLTALGAGVSRQDRSPSSPEEGFLVTPIGRDPVARVGAACANASAEATAAFRDSKEAAAAVGDGKDAAASAAFRGSEDACVARARLMCRESGSTFRFMLPIAAALGRAVAFYPEGRLPMRPLSPLYGELTRHGCAMSPQGSVPFIVDGRLTSGGYELEMSVSSQFISGLLFALPLLEGESTLKIIGAAKSFPYVEMTIEELSHFGVDVGFDGMSFRIPGRQAYRSPGVRSVEGDWSNAAFWLCAGALSDGGVACRGLNMRSRQGDMAVMEILRRFGARVAASGSSAVVCPGEALRGIEIDATHIPDLVPILSVVAAAAEGETVVRNAGRLREKESDRLAAVVALLRGLGADAKETPDGIVVRGRSGGRGVGDRDGVGCRDGVGAAGAGGMVGAGRTGGILVADADGVARAPLRGGKASAFGDHRIAMAAAIASTICSGPVELSGAEAVNKSYPGFFDDFRSLGGIVAAA